MTPLLYGFEEREKLMEFYERISGARLHAAFYRVGGVAFDMPAGLAEDIMAWTESFPKVLADLRKPAEQQPYLQAAHRRYRHRDCGRGAGLGLLRPEPARLRAVPGICARLSLMPSTTSWTSTSRWARTAIAMIAIWFASSRCTNS